jgi:hypothetical protein
VDDAGRARARTGSVCLIARGSRPRRGTPPGDILIETIANLPKCVCWREIRFDLEPSRVLPRQKRLKVVLKLLPTVRSGEPAGTRTQDPRLKRATQAVTTKDDRVRSIDTISLKSCNTFYCDCDYLRPRHISDHHQNRYRTATMKSLH